MPAKVFTFTAPPAAIVDLTPTLQAGGNLAPNTTYYYVVVPMAGTVYVGLGPHLTGNDLCRILIYGGISNEVTVTTDAVNKQVRLDWTAAAGAEAYCVFRSTVSDGYTGSKRLPRSSDGSGTFCTTLVNNTTDAGAYALAESFLLSVIPAGTVMPGGMNPRTNGLGKLTFDGGTAIDPITFQNIYDNAVATGWTNWCAWDKTTFTLMAEFLPTNNETYFLGLNATFNVMGWFYCVSTHASSILQFGQIGATGFTTNGVRFMFLGGGPAYHRNFAPGAKSIFYDCCVVGRDDVTDAYYISGIVYDSRFDLNAGTFKDFKLTNFLAGYVGADIPLIGVVIEGYYFQSVGDTTLSERCVCGLPFEINYTPVSRLDRLTSLYSLYQFRMNAHRNSWVVDGIFPTTLDYTYWLPYIAWWALAAVNDYVYILQSLKLKVVEAGVAIPSASISITDTLGVAATDFDGTAVTNFTTDAQGDLWREKITISAATANTITDGTKAWGVNAWKGRNVVINSGNGKGQQRKVISNTGTVLTFTENFLTTPAINDTAGIVLELYRARMNHKAGTGWGAGPAFTDYLLYTPHTVTLAQAGYLTRSIIYNMDRAREEVEKLMRKGMKKTIEGEILMEINAKGDLLRIAP